MNLAKKFNIKVGDEFTILGESVKITKIIADNLLVTSDYNIYKISDSGSLERYSS